MKENMGKCALCGRLGELTFEHIPPKAAFNSSPVKPVNKMADKEFAERLPWEIDGLPYLNLQRGNGVYSLCQECNNCTGSWYGAAYVDVAHIAHLAIKEYKNNASKEQFVITMQEIYPLRFIKQVLSMFCSLNPDNTKYDDLRSFVLDRDKQGLDKGKYKLCMYFLDSTFQKMLKDMVVGKVMNDGELGTMLLSEIAINPLGFILYNNPTDNYPYEGIDITELADYGYDDLCSVTIPFVVHETNSIFPEDFRSKAEIISRD